MLVVGAVMIFLVFFSTWALFRQADEIAKFTDEKPQPVEITPTDTREADLTSLAERVENFRQSLDREEETHLELTADELNLAIAAFGTLSELRGTFHIRELRDDGRAVIDISLKLNGKPRRPHDGESGIVASDPRFLNGTLIARPELVQGQIVLRLDSIEIPGKVVPEPFRQNMSPYRVTDRYLEDPVIGPAMKKLTSVEVTGGKVILRKTPGVNPPQTITNDQVDTAANRLFKWLGIAAATFLVVVGLLIFIGFRLKKRKDAEAK